MKSQYSRSSSDSTILIRKEVSRYSDAFTSRQKQTKSIQLVFLPLEIVC